VRFCHRLLQAQGDCVRVVCCTSTFHQPRCTVLLRLLGYEVVDPSMSSSWRHLGRTSYAMLVAKELVATPYDMLILLARRAIGRL
jgi:uncharacterized SAM-binding protein YcdF (DUF218 family)